MSRIIFCFCIYLSLAGCSTPVSVYKDTGPKLQVENFFKGDLVAHGLVQDRNGKVLRRFVANLHGSWKGTEGTLREHFIYDDGETQERTWRLEKIGENRYVGHAGDIVGTAVGESAGFALNWHYTLAVPVNGKVWNLKLNDWMYLVDRNRLFNRTEMTKFGIKVGELTLWIERNP